MADNEGTRDVKLPGVTWEEGEKLDYATIAKAGGRRDLLYHFDNIHNPNALAATWPRQVNWFAHPTPPPRLRGESYQSHLTEHWSRWDPSKKVSLPDIVKEPSQEPRKASGEGDVKLPPVTKKDNVDFGRLMALDYQREWLQNKEEKERLQKQKAKERRMAQRKKLQKHCMKARMNLVKPEDIPEEQKRYIMKRFANIPSKVKLPTF